MAFFCRAKSKETATMRVFWLAEEKVSFLHCKLKSAVSCIITTSVASSMLLQLATWLLIHSITLLNLKHYCLTSCKKILHVLLRFYALSVFLAWVSFSLGTSDVSLYLLNSYNDLYRIGCGTLRPNPQDGLFAGYGCVWEKPQYTATLCISRKRTCTRYRQVRNAGKLFSPNIAY